MKLHSDLPVYKSTYDLLLGIFEFTKGFSKEYKYTVGESLKKETIGTATWITIMVMQTETTTIRKKFFQFVASGIRLFTSKNRYSFSNPPCADFFCYVKNVLIFKFTK
jgi:hypothetical protein